MLKGCDHTCHQNGFSAGALIFSRGIVALFSLQSDTLRSLTVMITHPQLQRVHDLKVQSSLCVCVWLRKNVCSGAVAADSH